MIKPSRSGEFEMIQEERFHFETKKLLIEFFLRAIAYSLIFMAIFNLFLESDTTMKIISVITFALLATFLLYVKDFLQDVYFEYVDDVNIVGEDDETY